MRNIEHSLTSKQLRWIEEYLVDFNGAAAAIRAGYSEKSARSIAHENTTKPDIQAVLQARQAAMAKELQITREGVIAGLLEAVEMGRAHRNPMAMISALREVGKMLGFYAVETKRVELTSGQKDQDHFGSLSDSELIKIIAMGQAVGH